MNNTLRSLAPSLGFALFLAGPLAAQTTVHYQETFSGLTGNQAFATYGWSAHAGPLAADRSTNIFTSSNDGQFVSPGASPDSSAGIGAKTFATTGRTAIEWTAEFAPVSTALLSSIAFQTRNDNFADVQRVAIRIDSTWYVSAATFANSASAWQQHTLTFSSDASSWLALDFVPGSSLGLGAVQTSDLPAGNLTAIGLFNPVHAGTYRFDDVTITTSAIPEPSAFAMLGGAVALGVAVAGRRRRGA